MWFEPIVDFVVNLFPTIQQTALGIMEWITTEITIGDIETGFYIYEVLFGGSLTIILTYCFVSWILAIWPG